MTRRCVDSLTLAFHHFIFTSLQWWMCILMWLILELNFKECDHSWSFIHMLTRSISFHSFLLKCGFISHNYMCELLSGSLWFTHTHACSCTYRQTERREQGSRRWGMPMVSVKLIIEIEFIIITLSPLTLNSSLLPVCCFFLHFTCLSSHHNPSFFYLNHIHAIFNYASIKILFRHFHLVVCENCNCVLKGAMKIKPIPIIIIPHIIIDVVVV